MLYYRRMKKKNRAAVALGRRGGKKGGPSRWKGVSALERSAIMRGVIAARWDRPRKPALDSP